MAKSKVKFGEPPVGRGHDYDWADIAEQLRKRPGEWALVFENDKVTYANAMKQGGIRALAPDQGFEYRTTDNTREYPRTCTLWMRYVGKEK